MRKIIITVIATIVLIAPFEKAKGQTYVIVRDFYNFLGIQTIEFSSNVPTFNVLTGAHSKISLGRIWRFYPFIQFAPYFQWREQSISGSAKHERRNYFSYGYPQVRLWTSRRRSFETHPSRFSSVFKYGFDFRITDRNFVRLSGESNITGNHFTHFSIEYVRREQISQRISMDLSVGFIPNFYMAFEGTRSAYFYRPYFTGSAYGPGSTCIMHYTTGPFPEQVYGSDVASVLGRGFKVGAKFRYNISNNFKIEVGLVYLHLNSRYSRIEFSTHGFHTPASAFYNFSDLIPMTILIF